VHSLQADLQYFTTDDSLTTWTPPPGLPITSELDVPSDEESGDDGEQ